MDKINWQSYQKTTVPHRILPQNYNISLVSVTVWYRYGVGNTIENSGIFFLIRMC